MGKLDRRIWLPGALGVSLGVYRSYSCFGPYPRWLSWGPCQRDSCTRSTGVSLAVSYETSLQQVPRQSPWDCCLLKGSRPGQVTESKLYILQTPVTTLSLVPSTSPGGNKAW